MKQETEKRETKNEGVHIRYRNGGTGKNAIAPTQRKRRGGNLTTLKKEVARR